MTDELPEAWRIEVEIHQPEEYAEADEKAWVPYQGPQGGEGWQDTSTGDVIYDDEPPGEAVGEELRDADDQSVLDAVEEVFDQESREALEEADLSGDELTAAMQELASPKQLEEVAEAVGGGTPDVDEDAEYFEGADMDMRERVGIANKESDPDESTILFDHIQHQVKENVKDASGEPEAAEELFDLMEDWREDSFDEDAAQLERTFKEALGLDGDVRGDFDTSEPTEAQKEAARAIAGASRQFFREEFGESRQLKRGVGQGHRDQMLDDYLTEGEVSLRANATDNYSAYDKAPRYFAENTGAIVQPEVEAGDVAAATESLFIKEKVGYGDEYIVDPPSEISLTDTRLAAPVSSILTNDENYERFSDDPNDMRPEFLAALAESYDGDEPEALGEWLSGLDKGALDELDEEQRNAIGEYTS